MRPFVPHWILRHRPSGWLPIMALLLLAGCDVDRGDYGRFDVTPTGPALVTEASWKMVLDAATLPEPLAIGGFVGLLGHVLHLLHDSKRNFV